MDRIDCFFKRGGVPVWLLTPALDTFHLCISPPPLRVHFLTNLAFGIGQDALVYQFPTACFTSAVFMLAVGSKLSPFPIAAAKDVLVVVAHGVI